METSTLALIAAVAGVGLIVVSYAPDLWNWVKTVWPKPDDSSPPHRQMAIDALLCLDRCLPQKCEDAKSELWAEIRKLKD